MWDQRYSSEEYIGGKESNEFLGNAIGKIYKGKVKCIANAKAAKQCF
ncbi:MAG: hypothetical protein R3240_08430 [Gammaproteobacteria bacterium]|nr:hypothetical protein [Gammaproteobacteria bacterium]